MNREQREELPSIVREIKEATEELIQLFDQVFLHLCGIRWERDIGEDPLGTARGRNSRFWPSNW